MKRQPTYTCRGVFRGRPITIEYQHNEAEQDTGTPATIDLMSVTDDRGHEYLMDRVPKQQLRDWEDDCRDDHQDEMIDEADRDSAEREDAWEHEEEDRRNSPMPSRD